MRDDEDDDLLPPAIVGLAADERWQLPEESRAVLVEGLKSGEREVQLEALAMLEHSLDDGLATAALEIARGEGDEELRVAAARALAPGLAAAAAASEDEVAAPIAPATVTALSLGLRQLYFDSAAPKALRRAALETATQAPEAWQEGAVRAAWASGDAEWKTTAVDCMARLDGFCAELVEALRDRSPQIRLGAARATGDAGCREAAPRLLALARAADEEALVRMAAMESLGLLGDREAIAPLRELAASADPELAFAARSALGRIAGCEAAEELDDDFG
ncbi:MAG TPA: HEAT repeat domain-containing protein [Thermoanaerobaculia bacterium]|jgi:HEAT repeat protein|nr:HEAT repeat domain-containing protein [Thermoanaerobaculia bacterium]